jgi:hypothetical protein
LTNFGKIEIILIQNYFKQGKGSHFSSFLLITLCVHGDRCTYLYSSYSSIKRNTSTFYVFIGSSLQRYQENTPSKGKRGVDVDKPRPRQIRADEKICQWWSHVLRLHAQAVDPDREDQPSVSVAFFSWLSASFFSSDHLHHGCHDNGQ